MTRPGPGSRADTGVAAASGTLAAVREGADGAPRADGPARRSLREVAERLGLEGPAGGADVVVARAVLDSRAARAGDLYAALPGEHTHGARHAGTAVDAGAVAVLTDPRGAQTLAGAAVPVLVVEDPRARLGPLAQWLAGDPAQRLTTIGVTGTNGKTTTTALVESAIAASGGRAGLIGTTGTRIAGETLPGARTTPEAPVLAGLLAAMVGAGVEVCALEVSSHAVVMHRADGLVLDVVGFTQLSQDHLDLHGDMESYFMAKASLFTPERARRAVVVVDDGWGARLAGLCRERGLPVTTVSVAGHDADVTVEPGSVRGASSGGSTFTLRTAGGTVATSTPLPGRFNVSNAALAHALLTAVGLSDAAAALPRAHGPAGRMQVVTPRAGGGQGVGRPDRRAPRGVVDYAHTPDAVRAALEALRPSTPGRLVVVLGAGGDRDRGKRAAMGAAAAHGADVVVVTDDNPRSEDPALIRAAVLDGAREALAATSGSAGRRHLAELLEVAGRGEAVRRAVASAGPGSTVLVAGKGHERGQEVRGQVHPFDDVAELAAALGATAHDTGESGRTDDTPGTDDTGTTDPGANP